MNLQEVKVSGLIEFVESEQYKHFDIKPVSKLRAISQFHNPAAQPNDTALVYVADGNRMFAFAGLLPDRLPDQTALSCNSGWWVAPGKNYLALPVFLKALEKCHNHMFFTDCSAHTKSILEKTGLFEFQPEIKGSRYFLRSCLSSVLKRKKKNKMLVALARVADLAINQGINLITFHRWGRISRNGFSAQRILATDSALDDFIAANSGDSILSQSPEKLKWILNHPWIQLGNSNQKSDYPFSEFVESFDQQLLLVKKQNEIVAVVIVNIISGMASVPFIFYRKRYLTEVTNQIGLYLKQKKAESLVVFNDEVRNAIEHNGIPVVFTKRISKFAGFSVQLKGKINKNKYFQDGDGDVAFA